MSMYLGNDEPTQEYAVEALSELITIQSIQVGTQLSLFDQGKNKIFNSEGLSSEPPRSEHFEYGYPHPKEPLYLSSVVIASGCSRRVHNKVIYQ